MCVTRRFLATGSGLRSSEEVKEVTGQEDNKPAKTEAVSQLDVSDTFTFPLLYLTVSWLFALLATVANI